MDLICVTIASRTVGRIEAHRPRLSGLHGEAPPPQAPAAARSEPLTSGSATTPPAPRGSPAPAVERGATTTIAEALTSSTPRACRAAHHDARAVAHPCSRRWRPPPSRRGRHDARVRLAEALELAHPLTLAEAPRSRPSTLEHHEADHHHLAHHEAARLATLPRPVLHRSSPDDTPTSPPECTANA